MGEMTIELYWKHAPNTCRNFAELVRRGMCYSLENELVLCSYLPIENICQNFVTPQVTTTTPYFIESFEIL